MIPTISNANQSLNAERGLGPSPARRQRDNPASRQLSRVVDEIDNPQVKAIVGRVFEDLLRLLECLSLIESHLRQVDRAEETFSFFELIHDEARALVEFIRTDALGCAAMSEDLLDTLDGTSFAITHDLQRVFDTEACDRTSLGQVHIILSRLHRAHDVLTNCLQQSTISLAVIFDPELIGTKLFNNSEARYLQSLQLCKELATLRDLVGMAEQINEDAILSSLSLQLEKFRSESLECLMYSDWPQFEGFCEMIAISLSDRPRLQPVLHQFQCYLETLLGQVRMRAVLADGSAAFDGTDYMEPRAAFVEDFASLIDSAFESAPVGTFSLAVQ